MSFVNDLNFYWYLCHNPSCLFFSFSIFVCLFLFLATNDRLFFCILTKFDIQNSVWYTQNTNTYIIIYIFFIQLLLRKSHLRQHKRQGPTSLLGNSSVTSQVVPKFLRVLHTGCELFRLCDIFFLQNSDFCLRISSERPILAVSCGITSILFKIIHRI